MDVQRKFSQHLKRFGAQTMDHILCIYRSMILMSVQWCIHGLIPVILWLCIISGAHHFQKHERYDIQRLVQKIPIFNCGSSMLATVAHFNIGRSNRRSHWMDSKLIISIILLIKTQISLDYYLFSLDFFLILSFDKKKLFFQASLKRKQSFEKHNF